MRTIAIAGMSPVTRERANFEPDSVEIWGMTFSYRHLTRIDRYYEVHSFEGNWAYDDPAALEFYKTTSVPVYQIEPDPRVPTSVPYPIAEIGERFRDYFTCTVSYMLAHAAYEGVDEIHLWGVDCASGTEYEEQRNCVEFWLGVCEGLGIKVEIPDSSPILKSPNGVYGLYSRQTVSTGAIKEVIDRTQIGLVEAQVAFDSADTVGAKRKAKERYIAQAAASEMAERFLGIADPRTKKEGAIHV